MVLDTDEPEITQDELVKLFGATMPIEAVEVLFDGNISTKECRKRLTLMASVASDAPMTVDRFQSEVNAVLGKYEEHCLDMAKQLGKLTAAALASDAVHDGIVLAILEGAARRMSEVAEKMEQAMEEQA